MTDWRDGFLDDLRPLPLVDGADAVGAGRLEVGDVEAVVAIWDFGAHGGSFGEADATAFVEACHTAVAERLPLVSLVRSGGTRLQQGMRSLVGIPRAVLALDELATAGLAHVAVADQPTTGGVWVAIGSAADVRVGVAGATVGFSGPRVVEAMTGAAPPAGANTAESAAAAGMLDIVVSGPKVVGTLRQALRALTVDTTAPATTPAGPMPSRPKPSRPKPSSDVAPDRTGWEQVRHSRAVDRPGGDEILAALLDAPAALRGGDATVAAAIGHIAGRRACVIALAAQRAARVTPAGFRLLARGAGLAGRLDLPLVVLVDTAGADPRPDSEDAGLAASIRDAMSAVLGCAAPTIAVVHGEGGSGGALAGAVCDHVSVTATGWFAALGPEGAAATLHRTPQEAADLMHVAPADLLASGFADADAPTDLRRLTESLAVRIDELRADDPAVRRQRRRSRWSSPLR